MLWFVKDGVGGDPRLKICRQVLDGLLGTKWVNDPRNNTYLKQWVRIIFHYIIAISNGSCISEDVFLIRFFKGGAGYLDELMACNSLFETTSNSKGSFWRSVDAQCVAFVVFRYAWHYTDHSREDLSVHMSSLLGHLHHRSALLLEVQIDRFLADIDQFVKELQESQSQPPAYLSELKVSLQAQMTRIEELKDLPPTNIADVPLQETPSPAPSA